MEILRAEQFDRWLAKLKDQRARAKIGGRLDRLIAGNPGNWRSVGSGVIELKIDVGPG